MKRNVVLVIMLIILFITQITLAETASILNKNNLMITLKKSKDFLAYNNQNNEKIDSISDLQLKLLYEKQKITRKGKNKVYLLLTNTGSSKKTINFNTGQIFDVIISNKNERAVYKWSQGKRFTQSKEEINLRQDESKFFSAELKLRNIRPGEYYIKAIITGSKEVESSRENIVVE